MSNRKINRVPGIPDEDVDLLQNHGIIICKDVLCRNPLELMNISFSYKRANELLKVVSQTVAPKPVQVLDIFEKKKQSYLPTYLSHLDAALHGGLPSGTITEITGPPGCGKTQFCLTMSVQTAIHQMRIDGGTILYIDTENAFTAKRFLEIASQKLSKNAMKKQEKDVTEKVLVYFESTFESMMERLQHIEELIISRDVKLIVVDSIASLARKEFGHHILITERNALLLKEATLLKYYAETFNIPVLVTNQITTTVSGESDDSCMIAALGNTWAHAVNTRLTVRFADDDRRELTVTKSPLCPVTSMYYRISSEGVIMCS